MDQKQISRTPHALWALALLLMAGCATQRPVADVTRFHTQPPPASGTIALLPPPAARTSGESLAYKSEAEAISAALAAAGFTPVAEVGRAQYLVQVDYGQDSRPLGETAPPVTIGVGAGNWGRHLGIGIGTSFGLGKGKMQRDVRTWLSLAILRSQDRTRIWEGRASTHEEETDGTASRISLTARISQLARALLSGYPGPSGQSVVVKLDPPR